MILETVCVGQMQVNCYILAEGKGLTAIIIDPGGDEQRIRSALSTHKLTPAFIINTHGHIDHIGCDDAFGVPVYVHEKDSDLLKDPQFNLSSFLASPLSVKSKIKTVQDREKIELGEIQLEVMHIPGHTPGGICLLMQKPSNKIVFTGDSLFYHSIGRTDFPGADEDLLIESIKERLCVLSEDTVIYPGHGPSSTIKEEKRYNPFLNLNA